MKEKTKATIGSAILAGALLSGCSDVKNSKEIDSLEDYGNNTEHTEVNKITNITTVKKVFEPGTHFIEYYSSIAKNNPQNEKDKPRYINDRYHDYNGDVLGENRYNTNGFINNNVPVVEGYELFDFEPYENTGYYGTKTFGYVYVFVNTEKVEVTMYYDYDNNILYYNEPGVVVKEQTLK